MPGAAFFRKLGFVVIDDFLEPLLCIEVASEIARSAVEKGTVGIRSEDGEGRLDETVRKVLRAKMATSTKRAMNERLDRLTPCLAEHFHLTFTGRDGPDFLRYDRGAFYKPHEDAHGAGADGRHRAVSIVVFMNARAEHPCPGAYGGGLLNFHGLLAGAPWDRCAFALDALPGMLVAFPSRVVHEVGPVTFGHRCTMTAWLTAS